MKTFLIIPFLPIMAAAQTASTLQSAEKEPPLSRQVELYSKAIENNPKDVEAYQNRAWAWGELGQSATAINDLNKVTQLNPKSAWAWGRLAFSYNETERYGDAFEAANKALKLDPKYADAFFYRGIAQLKRGRKEEALKDFNDAIAFDPSHALAYYNRALLKTDLNKRTSQDVLQDLDQAVLNEPKSPYLYFERAKVKFGQGQIDQAVPDLSKSLVLNHPQKHRVYAYRGTILLQKQMYQSALEDFEKALAIKPTYEAAVQGKQAAVSAITQQAQETERGLPSTPSKRCALVIGNASYATGSLGQNPLNDASDIAARLKELDFQVTRIENASKAQMEESLNKFAAQFVNYDVMLVYYAGHGFEVDGVNYLIPIGAQLKNTEQVESEAIQVNRLLNTLNRTRSKINMLFLDACRDQPFDNENEKKQRSESASMTRSFRPIEWNSTAAQSTYIAMATSAGSTASNGTGRNGIYTGALLKHLRRGKELMDISRDVRNEVFALTQGTQFPAASDKMLSKFVF